MTLDIDKLLTTQELADRYDVNKRTIQKWAREGKVKGIKVSSLWRFFPEDLPEKGDKQQVDNQEEKARCKKCGSFIRSDEDSLCGGCI